MLKRNRKSQNARDLRQRHRRLFVEALERRICLTVPAFSSLPGADHTIYLDFEGETVTGTNWNSYYNQTTLTAQPYDIDGNSASFSATELARIEEAWKRTAEDFRPFEINVTTVDPGIEALRKSGAGDQQWGVRAIVTKESTMVNDSAEYCGCGGIAYIDSFNWSSDTPVWVYTTGGKSIAEAASHEAGHSLGLSHDGLNTGTTYYQGHGSGETGWASIMGVGYYQNVSQWDKGEYFDANNGGAGANYGDGPDDLALIVGTAGPGNGFGYRTDDHGNINVAASSIGLSGTTVADGGVIETTSDVDVFTFTTATGFVNLNIDPFTPGPNLDVKADLYDGGGSLIATSNSSTTLSASFSMNLSAGQYFLHVDGTGWGTPGANPPSGYTEYASLGQYSISGSIVDPGALPAVSIADASADEDAGTIAFTVTLSSAAAASTSVDWSTADGSATAGADYVPVLSGTVTFLAGQTSANVAVNLSDDSTYEGDETFFVNLTNPSGLVIGDGQGVGTIVEDDPLPAPTVSISDASANEGNFKTKGKNSGPQYTTMSFAVTLSAASTLAVSVEFSTADNGSATGDTDYQSATDQVVTFAPGETSKTINVTVIGDNDVEEDETFNVVLANAANADIGDGSATGTIVDNDTKKGGGKGGGGGKPNKSRSELAPIAVADPIWYFEGPDGGHDLGLDHDELPRQDHDTFPVFSSTINVLAVASLPLGTRVDAAENANDASRGELVDLVLTKAVFYRGSISSPNDSLLLERLETPKTDEPMDLESLLDQALEELTDELTANT